MRRFITWSRVASVAVVACAAVSSVIAAAADGEKPRREPPTRRPAIEILGEAQWARVETSIGKGLDFLASQQHPDGSFEARDTGQPSITSLAVLAFMSRGHLPEQGPYGKRLTKAVDFVVGCQREDGLLSFVQPESEHVHDG